MVGKRPVSDERKLLDAISTLKRITGTPNLPDKKDDRNTVFTSDYESAVVMANLLSQCLLKVTGHTEKFWSKGEHPRTAPDWHESVKIVEDGNQRYRIIFRLAPVLHSRMAEHVNEKAQRLIAPDKPQRSR